MADAAAPDAPADGEGGKKKFSGKKLLIILVPVLLLTIGGGAAWFLGFFGGKEEHAAEQADAPPPPPPPTIIYDLPDLLVNLSLAQRGRGNFIKLTASLEVVEADVPEFEDAMPRIVDTFVTYLRELRPEDLRGSAGLTRLREEMLRRVQAAARPARVQDVLFREILVQ
ncbi:MAG: flagellar basal body-associated FliL family protein [Alphaproteobacteria bacterium]|jgi:flagellar protein FliL|nr:flagellar basal body-associated FliL family protein [Alphaproteobacteria bacterium]